MKIIAIGRVRPGTRLVISLVTLCLFVFFLGRGINNYSERLISIEIKSDRFPGQVTVVDPEALREINGQVDKAEAAPTPEKAGGEYRLVLVKREGTRTFLFHQPDILYEPRTGKCYALRDRGRCLKALVAQLEAKNPFGKILAWSEVNEIFPKFDKARVRDLDTGLSFLVQRRAGSKHADVQPLTAEDSAVMKKIYGGQWSWRRRAIIVELKGYRIAASMNGMPHGAGAISGNDFDGHFCIHFKGSKTHSNNENLAHQMMVWKAAGVFEDMLSSAKPEYILTVFLTSMEQADVGLTGKLLDIPPDNKDTAKRLADIRWIVVSKISEPERTGEDLNFKVKMSYALSDGTSIKNRLVPFKVVRSPGRIPWKVDPDVLTRLLDKEIDMKDTGPAASDGSVYYDWKVDMEM